MRNSGNARHSRQNPTIREKAYQHIQDGIADGTLPRGAPISEVSLAKELGSSRTPVREAISQLVSEGILEQSRSHGTIVARIDHQEIVYLYELLESLELFVVAKVARERIPAEDLKRLEQMSGAIGAVAEELDASGDLDLSAEQIARFAAADRGFHTMLMALSFNPRIRKVVDETRLLIRIFAARRVGYRATWLKTIHAQHQGIIQAIASGDSVLATLRLSEHLRLSMRDRLEELDRHRRSTSIEESYSAMNV